MRVRYDSYGAKEWNGMERRERGIIYIRLGREAFMGEKQTIGCGRVDAVPGMSRENGWICQFIFKLETQIATPY